MRPRLAAIYGVATETQYSWTTPDQFEVFKKQIQLFEKHFLMRGMDAAE